MSAKKTVAAQVVNTLRELGVRHVFGVPSGGWVDYMEALRTTAGIEFILTTEEGSAGMMAEVCGRLTGAPGVCFGTFGPGATNLASGVGEALLDRSPMIALTDEMPAAMRGRTTQMGIDHQALFAPLTKKTTRLSTEAVRETLYDAARVALEGRPGPVHIGLPVGLSAEQAAEESVVYQLPRPAPAASADVMAQMTDRFMRARKPLLAVGLGAAHAGVGPAIRALAEKHRIPVVLTPMAKGLLDETHDCYAGVLFHALSNMVGETHQQADLIVGVGYDPVEFNYESWMPRTAALVSLDVAPADIDTAQYTLAADVVGNINASLEALRKIPALHTDWDMKAMQARRAAMFAKLAPSGSTLGPKAVLSILREVLPEDGIMTCDVGAHTHLIGQLWRTPAPGLQLMTNGWSAMGFGIPAAIAAKLSCPDKAVCAVVGDGGFLMTMGELATAVRYELPIVFLLLTDNDLALIRIKQQKKGNPIYGTVVRAGGNIGGANLMGVPVHTVSDAQSLRAQLTAALAARGPVIIEAIVDSREYDEVVLKKDKP
jgi:acetolactate synthase-1/2/3 large subunit